MGCNRVDVIFIFHRVCPVFIYCPKCGKVGSIHRKRMNTYGIGHPSGKRCSMTEFSRYQVFAKKVNITCCQMHSVKLIQLIRAGKLNTIIPTINGDDVKQCP